MLQDGFLQKFGIHYENKNMWKVVTVLSSIGILLAVYLLWEQFFRPPFNVCDLNSFVNCNAVISGKVATTFGISTPLIGLIGYIVMLFASLLKKRKMLLGTTTFGLIFCLWIAYQEYFLLHVICPICILCQLDMVGVFILAILLMGKKRKGIL